MRVSATGLRREWRRRSKSPNLRSDGVLVRDPSGIGLLLTASG